MRNEHIVGVAIYCIDLENITQPRLTFGERIKMSWKEYHFDWEGWDAPYLEELFNVKDDMTTIQETGSVPLRQGRLITFPNCRRHRLESFELRDKSRSGHCRFLTLWLVDPYFRLCSTRNVPPQRRDWWEEEVRPHISSAGARPMPPELADQIIADTGSWLMDSAEALCHQRERAKDEKSAWEIDTEESQSSRVCLFKFDG